MASLNDASDSSNNGEDELQRQERQLVELQLPEEVTQHQQHSQQLDDVPARRILSSSTQQAAAATGEPNPSAEDMSTNNDNANVGVGSSGGVADAEHFAGEEVLERGEEEDSNGSEYPSAIGRIRIRSIDIDLCTFQNDNQVARAAHLLRSNRNVKNIWLDLSGIEDHRINWDPLFLYLEFREKLDKVDIVDVTEQALPPPFQRHFLQALQRNPSLRSLRLGLVDFSVNFADAFVSLLVDGRSNLRELILDECKSGETEAAVVAAALQRNANLRVLRFECCDIQFPRQIFQLLASSERSLGLTTIAYEHPFAPNFTRH